MSVRQKHANAYAAVAQLDGAVSRSSSGAWNSRERCTVDSPTGRWTRSASRPGLQR